MLDTNAWVEQLGLRSAAGSALIHGLKVRGGRLVLPEVVEMELVEKLSSKALEAAASIEGHLRVIQLVTGSSPDPSLPDADSIRAAIESWISSLEDLFVRVRLTEDLARTAVQSAVAKVPPNHGKEEQVRDTLIWLSALQMGGGSDVLFVTNDGDFIENSTLHPALASQAEDEGVSVRWVPSIAAALDLIVERSPLPVDTESILRRIADRIDSDVRQTAADRRWILGRRLGGRVALYATEQPNRLAVDFEFSFELRDYYSAQELELMGAAERVPYVRNDGRLSVLGSAFLNHSTEAIDGEDISTLRFQWVELGEPRQSTAIRSSTGIYRRTRTLRTREPLR